MKRKFFLLLIVCLFCACLGCSKEAGTDTSKIVCSMYGAGTAADIDGQTVFLLNGMLYGFNENTLQLELFCDNKSCSHTLSTELTEPSQCPAALGNGYFIGFWEDVLYAAVKDAGWNIYTLTDSEGCPPAPKASHQVYPQGYSLTDSEKHFVRINHIYEIIGDCCLFDQNYLYYFEKASTLKRVKLIENSEPEVLWEKVTGSEYDGLHNFKACGQKLVMTGFKNGSCKTWIYDISTEEKTEIHTGGQFPDYCDGKLFYIESKVDSSEVYAYDVKTGTQQRIMELDYPEQRLELVVDKDYIYIKKCDPYIIKDISAMLYVYSHAGQLIKEVSIGMIEENNVNTVMCSNDSYIFLGRQPAAWLEQSLYMIQKDALKQEGDVEVIPLLVPSHTGESDET